MIELKQLQMLEAISQHGTISGAAKALGYSQPAISQHMATIERMLETPVLVRSRSGVHLTEAGKLLVDAAGPILAQVGQVMSEVTAIAGLRAGKVRVSCFPSAASVLLPGAFAEVREQHPGLSFALAERDPVGGLEMLRHGQCDIAIIFDYVTPGLAQPSKRLELLPNETAVTLLEEEIMVALPPDHPRASDRWIDIEVLNGEQWIAGCPDCRTHLVEACETAGYHPDITFETDDYLAMQGLVGAGLGIALIPEVVLAAARHQYPIALLPTHPISTRVIRAVTTESMLRVPGIVPTIEALKATAARRIHATQA